MAIFESLATTYQIKITFRRGFYWAMGAKGQGVKRDYGKLMQCNRVPKREKE